MRYQQVVIIIFILCMPLISQANNTYTVSTNPATKDKIFIFKSAKGIVRFNHDLHQSVMKTEACIPCHKTASPTKEHTMTRFDQRAAHSFCKGCHREKQRGPVECHECHKEK